MPAAAVIPAPIAYIKVVAVKKLVVELLVESDFWLRSKRARPSVRKPEWTFTGCFGDLTLYFEKIRVFKAGYRHEYFSME